MPEVSGLSITIDEDDNSVRTDPVTGTVETGALPVTHALYTDAMCLLCHDIRTAGPRPSASPWRSSTGPRYTLEPSAPTTGG